jgi:hypothetical protein
MLSSLPHCWQYLNSASPLSLQRMAAACIAKCTTALALRSD